MPNVYFLQGAPATDEQMAQKISKQGALYLSNDVSGNSNSNRLYIGRTNATGGIKSIVTPTPFKQIIQFNGATKSSFDGTADVTTNIQAVSLISSTNNALARFDGTGGFIKNSTVILDDNGNINTPGIITANKIQNTSGNGSIDSNGYVIGTWLKVTANNASSTAAGKVCIQDANGWIYTRTPVQLLSDMGVTASSTELNILDGATITISGNTITGNLTGTATNATNAVNSTNANNLYVNATSADTNYYILGATGTGNQSVYRALNSSGTANTTGVYFNGVTGVLFGAAWNDYAEFRQSEELEAGRVVCETGKGNLVLSTERLQPGAEIISDTFGFAIGETDKCKTPIAASGRVLAYTFENRYEFKAGDAVCAAPGGTVSKMTRDEIINYPDRIIGTVSEIPEYDTWGQSNIKVNNRIWIRIR